MNTQLANSAYEIIIVAFVAAIIAQLIKMLFHFRKNKKMNFRILVGTGGMPSSHSAFVCGLATSVGLIRSWNSAEFAIAVGFAFVVMYDAAGLRRAAGKMASVLNNIADDVYKNNPREGSERLMELLGHTPMEVLMGATLGFTTALAIHTALI